ncbi:hypothetical protein [Rhodococcus koreensis]
MAGFWDRPARDEFHLLIAGMCLISGLGSVNTENASESMAQLPLTLQVVWAYTLLVTSVLILIGAFWPDERDGYWPELAGMLGLGFITAAYAFVVIFYLEGQSPFGALILLAVTVACFVRAVKIIIRLRATPSHEEKVVARVKKLVEEQARNELHGEDT